ncbi:hypothetical protein Ancab_032548 [Ancistrocladus abbreviatus]
MSTCTINAPVLQRLLWIQVLKLIDGEELKDYHRAIMQRFPRSLLPSLLIFSILAATTLLHAMPRLVPTTLSTGVSLARTWQMTTPAIVISQLSSSLSSSSSPSPFTS